MEDRHVAFTDFNALMGLKVRRVSAVGFISGPTPAGLFASLVKAHRPPVVCSTPFLRPRQGMEPQSFFGVYDGHGGLEAAKFTQAQLHCNIVAQESFKDDVPKALVDGFLETDRQFLRKAARDALECGATACTALVRGRKLHVAWLGDSQVRAKGKVAGVARLIRECTNCFC